MSDLGNIRKVTPSDTEVISSFKYIQVGTTGDVALKSTNGSTVVITSGLLDRMAIVPTGVYEQVLTTGTTATDIYVWG